MNDSFGLIDILIFLGAGLVVWLIGWGRHLCDKSLARHILGGFIIALCYLIIVFGIYASLAVFGLRHLSGSE